MTICIPSPYHQLPGDPLRLTNLTANFDDDYDDADEETNTYVNKEVDDAEKNDDEPYGKPGSLVNRMIMHGNKKTEDQIAAEQAQKNVGDQSTAQSAATTTTSAYDK